MAPVVGGAAHVVDRRGGPGGQLPETPEHRGVEPGLPVELGGEELLGGDGPAGVGAAEPMPVPTRRSPGCSAIANEQTAITMALRVPTLEKYCGPLAGLVQNARISSSASSALRLTPR